MEFQSGIEMLVVEKNTSLSKINIEGAANLTSLVVYDNANLEMVQLPELPSIWEVFVNKNPKLTQLSLTGLDNRKRRLG